MKPVQPPPICVLGRSSWQRSFSCPHLGEGSEPPWQFTLPWQPGSAAVPERMLRAQAAPSRQGQGTYRQPHPGRGDTGSIQSPEKVCFQLLRSLREVEREIWSPHRGLCPAWITRFPAFKKKKQQQNSRKLHLGANLHAQTHWFPQLLIQQPGTAKIQSSRTSSVVSPGAAR